MPKKMTEKINDFLDNKSCQKSQLLKYVLCGVLATICDFLVFYIFSLFVFRCIAADDIIVKLLGIMPNVVGGALRARFFVINSMIAFFVSNTFAYISNSYCVFESVRKNRFTEIVLFYVFSIISIIIGTGLGWILIDCFNVQTTVSYFIKVIACLAFNFIARKFVVFKGTGSEQSICCNT
jgi:putative flippase GtrA